MYICSIRTTCIYYVGILAMLLSLPRLHVYIPSPPHPFTAVIWTARGGDVERAEATRPTDCQGGAWSAGEGWQSGWVSTPLACLMKIVWNVTDTEYLQNVHVHNYMWLLVQCNKYMYMYLCSPTWSWLAYITLLVHTYIIIHVHVPSRCSDL